ncbi:MAG: hypothetical protein QXO40_01670 [Candidatus Aenigmatarchaeota archaeon]
MRNKNVTKNKKDEIIKEFKPKPAIFNKMPKRPIIIKERKKEIEIISKKVFLIFRRIIKNRPGMVKMKGIKIAVTI